jgi:hypothetical protein
LDENLIECSRTLYTAATSSVQLDLLPSLVNNHQLVEKLASAVRDVTTCWLQQPQQQAQQQQPAEASSADAPAPNWSFVYSQLCTSLSSLLLKFLEQQAVIAQRQQHPQQCFLQGAVEGCRYAT